MFATFRVILPAAAAAQAGACLLLLLRRKSRHATVLVAPCCGGAAAPPIWSGLRASDLALAWQCIASLMQCVLLAWAPYIVTSLALFLPEATSLWSSALMGTLFSRIMTVGPPSPSIRARDRLVMMSVIISSFLYAILIILHALSAITTETFRNVGAPLALGVAPLITIPAIVRILLALRVLRVSPFPTARASSAASRTAPGNSKRSCALHWRRFLRLTAAIAGAGLWKKGSVFQRQQQVQQHVQQRVQQQVQQQVQQSAEEEVRPSRLVSPMELSRSAAYVSHIKRFTLASCILIVTQLTGLYLTKALAITPSFYTPAGLFAFGLLSALGPLGAGMSKIIAFLKPRLLQHPVTRVMPRRASAPPRHHRYCYCSACHLLQIAMYYRSGLPGLNVPAGESLAAGRLLQYFSLNLVFIGVYECL